MERDFADTRLGNFEHDILSLLSKLPNSHSYGAKLVNLFEQLDMPISIGALYTTLKRMEEKNLVVSFWGFPQNVRGGRRKRYYIPTTRGMNVLADNEQHRAKLMSFKFEDRNSAAVQDVNIQSADIIQQLE